MKSIESISKDINSINQMMSHLGRISISTIIPGKDEHKGTEIIYVKLDEDVAKIILMKCKLLLTTNIEKLSRESKASTLNLLKELDK